MREMGTRGTPKGEEFTMQTVLEPVQGVASGLRAYRSTDGKTWEVGPVAPVSDMDREHVARSVPSRDLARLFAAAPDLLAACKALYDASFNHKADPADAQRLAADAIRKATEGGDVGQYVSTDTDRTEEVDRAFQSMSLRTFTENASVSRRGAVYRVRVRHNVGFGGSRGWKVTGVRDAQAAILTAYQQR